jgi:hypothetical protein
MATMAWDEDTDNHITKIDAKIGDRYNLSLRVVLSNPDEYGASAENKAVVKKIKNEVNTYFDGVLSNLKGEQAEFDAELKRITDLYDKIDTVIGNSAKASNVPYTVPIMVSRDVAKDEIITINEYDDTIEPLVKKLAERSIYIADLSTNYRDYIIGFWLFAGDKNIALAIAPPPSIILSLEASRGEITRRLDQIIGPEA